MGLCRIGVALALGVVCASAAALPNACLAADGRGFELVSPPDKSGNSIDVRATVQGSLDGDAVAFSAPGAFGDASTSISGGYYVARRSPSAWSSHGIDAPQGNTDGQIAIPTLFLADDLSRTFQFSARALLPGAIEGGGNLYLADTQGDRRDLVAASSEKTLTDEFVPYAARLSAIGASSDLSHIVFSSTVRLLPEATAGATNVYEYANGRLRLASILEDQTTVDTGASIGSDVRSSRFVSADGSKVFFNSSSGVLYARVDGTTTVPISVSRRTGDPSTPVAARFGAASKDGNVVYFLTTTPLTDDTPGGGFFPDLYRYDFSTDRLTNESLANVSPEPANILKLNAVSENGEYAYFYGWGQLTPDAVPFQPNFYVAHNGEVRLVAIVNSSEPYVLSTSRTGRYVAFASTLRLTSADTTDPACRPDGAWGNSDGACVEVYLYDAVSGTLRCPGCNPVDGRNRFADLGPRSPSISGYLPTLITDDGRLFFNSEARLVSEDTNGRRDVYEWDGQRASLVSSGRGSGDSTLADVSADGRDIYFFTPQRLVARDTDNAVDLYDARLGGGLASQNEVPADSTACAGDGCQGVLAPARGLPEIPTVSFDGRGNLSPSDEKPSTRASKARISGPTTIRGTSFVLKVKVPEAGRISISAGRLVPVGKTVSRPGTYRLRVKLTARAKRALRSSRRLKVPVRVAYVSKSGVRSSTTLNVTFKA